MRAYLVRFAIRKVVDAECVAQPEALPAQDIEMQLRARPQPEPGIQVQRHRLADFAAGGQAVRAGISGIERGIALQSRGASACGSSRFASAASGWVSCAATAVAKLDAKVAVPHQSEACGSTVEASCACVASARPAISSRRRHRAGEVWWDHGISEDGSWF